MRGSEQGLSPTRQLFNLVLCTMTLACLVSLVKLWPTRPATAAMVAFVLVAGSVGLLFPKDKANFAALALYAALLILLNVLTK